VEQFIESIYPTQDPKAIALRYKTEAAASEPKEVVSESNKETIFLLLAVVGTLFVISAMMVCRPPRLIPSHSLIVLRLEVLI